MYYRAYALQARVKAVASRQDPKRELLDAASRSLIGGAAQQIAAHALLLVAIHYRNG